MNKVYIDRKAIVPKSRILIANDKFDLEAYIKRTIAENDAVTSLQSDVTNLQSDVSEIQNEWTTATVVITDSELTVAKDSPVDILGSAGADSFYVIDEIQCKYSKGASDFTVSGVTDLQLTQNNVAIASISPTLISNGKAIAVVNGMVPSDGVAPRVPVNGKIRLAAIGANPASGTGSTLTLVIKYKIVAF